MVSVLVLIPCGNQIGRAASKAGGLIYLQHESGEQRGETGRAASIPVFGIDIDIDVSTGAWFWRW